LKLDIINLSQQFLTDEQLNEFENYNNDNDYNSSQSNEDINEQHVEFSKYLVEVFKYKKHIVVPMETRITQVDDDWSLLDNRFIETPQKQQKENSSFLGKIFSYISPF
jgi:hypothetical protein